MTKSPVFEGGEVQGCIGHKRRLEYDRDSSLVVVVVGCGCGGACDFEQEEMEGDCGKTK